MNGPFRQRFVLIVALNVLVSSRSPWRIKVLSESNDRQLDSLSLSNFLRSPLASDAVRRRETISSPAGVTDI